MKGLPVDLDEYQASEVVTNKHFEGFQLSEFDNFYLPESMRPFTDLTPLRSKNFIADDNRGAVSNLSSVNIDGSEFYLSVKGIGSTTSPFSQRALGKNEICSLLTDNSLREKLVTSKDGGQRYITGELWLRGSPYGGQGLTHATTSMRISEWADLTSIHGFRIAPVVKIVTLPEDLQAQIKKLFWYRRFSGEVVQEIRLVPSNVRIYFHSGSTVGGDARSVLDLFQIDTDDKALGFLKNFVKSGIAFLTLFTRSITKNEDGSFTGLDYSDVWLDKDAVLAPDGTIYFVDLEGLESVTVAKDRVREKIDDQIYRSLYEFMYAYEQIQLERVKRFGGTTDRKIQFESLVREAVKDDQIVSAIRDGGSLQLLIGNLLDDATITSRFQILNW